MARRYSKVTLGTSLGEGQYLSSAGSSTNLSALVGTADTLAIAADAAADTTVTDTTAADAAATTADTDLGTVTGADTVATEAAVALLEADGASPTQAHVNALRTVWDTQVADGIIAKAATVAAASAAATAKTTGAATKVATAAAAVGTAAAVASIALGDLVLSYDTSVITTRNQLRAAIRAALQLAAGDGSLTG